MSTHASRSAEISALGLDHYVMQLEVDGLCVVPPEAHGVPIENFDAMVQWLLNKAQDMVGCPFSLDNGPQAALSFGDSRPQRGLAEDREQLTQFLIQRLASEHRLFRDLAINPVAVALIRHMIGHKATRFSSTNAFIKWQGDFGYGQSLGMHADQSAVPLPWGRTAMTANTNWCLTDYTLEGGALAYVPGSHRYASRPVFPQAVKQAVPVQAPKGSMIIFHGATWHGAFPRKIPGMRISVANYYRHLMVTSQEDIQNSFDRSLADDCDNPAEFKTLAGFADEFPYRQQNQAIPQVI
jgi:ectoine hydroxylase-related dioxygenase (phytanoyl-CoA dioxygenase family)